MIVLDSSAIVAILVSEPEEDVFLRTIAANRAVVGAPTLVETRLAMERRSPAQAETLVRGFVARLGITIVPFDATMFDAAIDAFARYGKGRSHPAQLNFGDCLSYAVAKTLALPLLFKGEDFRHTDIAPAYASA